MKCPVSFRFWLGTSYAMIVIQYLLSFFRIQKFSAVKNVPQKVFSMVWYLCKSRCLHLSHQQQIFTANDVWSWRSRFSGKDLTTVWLLPSANLKKLFCPVFSRLSGKFRFFGKLGENLQSLENMAFYQTAPENPDSLHSCCWHLSR